MNAIRHQLRNRRVRLGLSHKDVADFAGISRSYYTNIERGKKDPSLRVAERIARVLDSDISIFSDRIVPDGNDTIRSKCSIATNTNSHAHVV